MDQQMGDPKLKLTERQMVFAQNEVEICKIKEKIRSSYLQTQQLSTLTNEHNKKAMLLQLNAEKLRAMLNKTEEVSAIAKTMLELSCVKHKNSSSERVIQVETALQELQLKALARRQSYADLLEGGKCVLQELVNRRLAPFSVSELWHGTKKIHQKVNQTMKEQVSNIDVEKDLCQLRQEMIQAGRNVSQNGMAKLAALCCKLIIENTLQKKRNAGKQQQFTALKDELIQLAEERYKFDNPGELSVPVKDLHRWIDLRLEDQVTPVKVEVMCKRIQELKASTIDIDTRQWKVMKQEEAIGTSNAILEEIQNRLEQEIIRGKIYPDHLATLQETVRETLVGFSPDTIALMSQSISCLKGSVMQEVKEFEALPLVALHRTNYLSGPSVATYQQLIQYQLTLPCVWLDSSLPSLVTLLDGAPLGPVENIVVNLYEKKCYRTRLQRELNGRQSTSTCAANSKSGDPHVTSEALLLPLEEIDDNREGLLSQLQESSNSLETLLSQLNETFHAWLHHPFIDAVPSELLVEGKTLVEWVDCYKENLFFLDSITQVASSPNTGQELPSFSALFPD